jgi:nucleotide-binding universal stress UspA family protein
MKILLPVDGSAASLAAVRHALALRASGLESSYVLANVQEPPSLYEVVTAHDAEVLSAVRRSAGEDLLAPAEALLRDAGAEWESEVAGGDPGHVLVDLAENYGCDAVVMGVGAGAPGPVTLALVQHSPVPLTLVREPAQGAAGDAG